MSRENFEERLRQNRLEEKQKFYDEQDAKRTPEQQKKHEEYLDDMRKRYSLSYTATEAQIEEEIERISKGEPTEF